MRRFKWTSLLMLLASAQCLAQGTPANPAQPVRVCVATFKNETRQQADVSALRDRLAIYLKRGPLVKQSGAEIVPVKGDSDQEAAPEVMANSCEFVVYSRMVLGRLKEPEPNTSGGMPTYTVHNGPQKKGAEPTIVLGVQFTAVRVSSGIPVMIDRVFMDKPMTKEEELWSLLLLEQERIEAGLQKKMPTSKDVKSLK